MIGNLEHRAQDIYNQYLLHGKIVSAEIIKNEITGFDHKQRKLLASLAEHVHDMKTSEGHGYSSGTIKNWQVTERHLKDFIKVSYNAPDITFKELDHRFITEFEIFARREWRCNINAILKHIQGLKKVVTMAINKGWIEADPFVNFHRKQEKTHRTFLTKEELERIERKEFQLERLERVRDIFIFSCYTGLAFVDIEKLTQDNLVTGIDGKKWIYTFRQKTDTKSNIPLLPAALKIIEKYYAGSDNYTNKLLPLIINTKSYCPAPPYESENTKDKIINKENEDVRNVNTTILVTYYHIGRVIVEDEQKGQRRAGYAKSTVENLSKQLTKEFGKGYSTTNLEYFRKFFLLYRHRISQSAIRKSTSSPKKTSDNQAISQSPAREFQLSWTHYVQLLKIEDENERGFYEIEAAQNNWSVPEFTRQINSALYERVALSREKKGVKELAAKGQSLKNQLMR